MTDLLTHDHEVPAPEGHGGHGDHTEMFRRRFWRSLFLTVPVVLTSEMVMEWFHYSLEFPGIDWVGPVLGSVIFFWGGWPFLTGARSEIEARQPGMMLLIAMAVTDTPSTSDVGCSGPLCPSAVAVRIRSARTSMSRWK